MVPPEDNPKVREKEKAEEEEGRKGRWWWRQEKAGWPMSWTPFCLAL